MKVISVVKFTTASLLVILTSCTPDPYTRLIEDYNFSIKSLSTPRLFPGESLEAQFTAGNNRDPQDNTVNLVFDVAGGGGTVSERKVQTDSEGKAKVTWQLGDETFEQLLRVSICNKSGLHMKDEYLKAYSFMDNIWMEIRGDVDGTMNDLVTDTVNDITYMLSSNNIYRQGSRYFLWEKVNDDLIKPAQTIDIDGEGIIYVTTYYGDVIKSNDHGYSWIRCTKPYTSSGSISFHVSKDNYLWAFRSISTSRLSRDGGDTWVDVDIPMSQSGYASVFRLKDGTLIYHGGVTQSLHRSYDDGETWETILLPGYFMSLYINDNDEFYFTKTDNGGLTIYKSKDMGNSFLEIHHVYPASGAAIDGNFKKWNDYYYVVVPGYGILKTSDFEHYTDYWVQQSVYDLFIDHNEVLLVKSKLGKTVYYRRNTE